MAVDLATAETVKVLLLERESSLASLTTFADEARRGAGRLVLVAGETGIGKSALVEQLRHEIRDARWSFGGCDSLFTPRALGPLFDIAEQLGGGLLASCRARVARDELFETLLRQISDPEILDIVVVEDIHWADEATLDLLRFLARRIHDCSVLLVATYRDEGLTARDPLRVALGELATQRASRRLALAPLSADSVRILAEGSGVDADELYLLTGGNPLYVTEVLHAGIDGVPPSARDAVLARVARLSKGARHVVDVGALIGTRIELPLVELVTPCSASVVDELLGSGLMMEDGARLRFRHEIARLAVEHAIPAHRRALMHAQILKALRTLGSDDEAQMAFHAEGAGDAPGALHHAWRAAQRASELAAHREAVAQYERAIRFAGKAEAAVKAELYDALALEAALIDRWQDSADARTHALELWRGAGNRVHEGDTMRLLSRTMWRLCRGREALAAAESAIEILEPLGSTTELAWAYANLAMQRMFDAHYVDACELATRAREIAEPLGAFEVLSDAYNTEACAAAALGEEWVPRMRQALQVALQTGCAEQAGRAYANFYSLTCRERRFAEAESTFRDGIAYCDEHDISTFATCLRGQRTSALEQTGRWDDAVALALHLLNRTVASPINRINPLLALGQIRSRRGEPAAWECLDEATQTADGSAEPSLIVAVRLARAEAYFLEGKNELAARETSSACDVVGNGDAWERGAVAVWLRRTGSSRGVPGELAEPYRLQVDGDVDKAAQLWADLGCPYEAALALLDTADEGSLRKALAVFYALGAVASARLARQKMRRLGIRSIPHGARSATRQHPVGLTRREREVLELICDGHTNAQIAARLVVSARTVDHHVAAVLAKLGARSRGAAAAEAVRRGLVAPRDALDVRTQIPAPSAPASMVRNAPAVPAQRR